MVRSSHAAHAAPAASPIRRVVTGVTLLAFALTLAAQGLTVPADAQEVGGDTEAVEITELALYASPVTEAFPETLRTGIPPAAVCVVANELCPEGTADLRNQLSDGLNEAIDVVPPEPFHPVPPDTIAVSVLGGKDRYQSAVRFEAPPLPSGEEFTTFEVRFPVAQPTFDVNSPSFRRAILGLFETIADPDNDPELFFDGLEEALTDESPLDINEDILGIEACPFTAPFEPGGPPQAQSAEDDLPRDEEFGDVEVDCLLGTSGRLDEDAEAWVFDLTFAANAWGTGDLDNLGILMRPAGVPNLAFGDPDTSTSAQVAMDTEDVEITFASAEPPPPPEPFADDFDDGFDDGFEDGFVDDFAVQDDFVEMDGFEPGPAIGGPSDVNGPSAAPEAPQAAPDVGQQQQVMARPVGGEPINPWWLWLLVPLFGGGGYLVAAPLLAPTAAGGAATPGAMSRLLARTGGPGLPA